VDGEVVALDESGRPSFNVLQNNLSSHPPLEFYVFDLLHLAGRSFLKLPLTERRQMLREQVMPLLPGASAFQSPSTRQHLK
jgi:bifunctional non-homologous end joining protein LigD